ncbi:MAG: DJ-1/PfpI family protein [Clostridia bacterium]|nr:DJ-1/PfpI family protein [Clostridia bacterium]
MIYIFLAPGFEEIEAVVPRDVLKKANIDVATVSIGEKIVESTKGLKVISDMTINEVQIENVDGIILPGGMPGTSNLEKCEQLIEIIKTYAEKKLLIAAICAAPSILGKLGILSGKNACCFPDADIEKYLAGAKINSKDVNICENIITSKGPGTAFQFAFSIVEYIRGNEVRQKLSTGMQFSQ